MDYQEKKNFMLTAINILIAYADQNPEIDSPCLRSTISNLRKDVDGDCESLYLTIDNFRYGVGDISFGYTIKAGSLRLTFNQASTGTNLWVAEPNFLFEKLRIRFKQEELITSWFEVILKEWAKLHN